MPKVVWKLALFPIDKLLKHCVTARIDTLPDENDPVVLQYAELMREGVPMALPRVVRADNGTPYLVDGHHRVLAAKLNGETQIECEWDLGELKDAINCACAANREHGKPRSPRDIKNAVQLMHKTFPSFTQERIADAVGCSQATVCRALSDGKPTKKPAPTTAQQAKIAGSDYSPELNQSEPESDNDDERPRVQAVVPQDYTEQAGPPEHVFDELGAEVPAHLITFWKRRGELLGLRARVREVLGRMKRGTEEGDKLYTSIPAERAYADVCNADRMLTDSVPYALCPTCAGLVLEGCQTCSETGFVNEATAQAHATA